MKMEYYALSRRDPEALATSLNSYYAQGWTPVPGTAVSGGVGQACAITICKPSEPPTEEVVSQRSNPPTS